MWLGDIWIAADSRISRPSNTGARTVPTDAALKILPIRLDLYREYDEETPGAFPVYGGQYAFAYAGGVLPAMMTYAMATSYLKLLIGPPDAELPTISQVVALVNRMGTTYAEETQQPFEVFLVGQCPRHYSNRKHHAYRLRFDMTGKAREPELLNLDTDGSFALLGSNVATMTAAIVEGFAADTSYNPARAIKLAIETELSGDIGGYVHLARYNGALEIYPEWRDPAGNLPSPYSDANIGGLGQWRVQGIFGRPML